VTALHRYGRLLQLIWRYRHLSNSVLNTLLCDSQAFIRQNSVETAYSDSWSRNQFNLPLRRSRERRRGEKISKKLSLAILNTSDRWKYPSESGPN